MSLGGQSNIYAAQGGIPSIFNRLAAGDTSGGMPVGTDKYSQIMELMRMRQNMNPQTYTGGFNSSVPSSVSAAPSSYYEELLRQKQLANVNRGGGRQEVDPKEKARIDAFMDAEDAKDVANGDPVGTTRGERIKNDLGPIVGFLNPFDMVTSLADAYKGFQDPRDTTDQSFGSQVGRTIGGFLNSGPAYQSGPNGRMSATGLANLNSQPTISTDVTDLSQPTISTDVTDLSQPNGEGSFDNSAPGEGYGMTRSGGIDGSMFNKGGQVTMDRLQGPNPMGPDDGYAGLKDGEFVINAKSVGKYGIELMNAINAGKISKGKLRGLLEA